MIIIFSALSTTYDEPTSKVCTILFGQNNFIYTNRKIIPKQMIFVTELQQNKKELKIIESLLLYIFPVFVDY